MCFTPKVKLSPLVASGRALAEIMPRRQLSTEFIKLDFPAPTGPCKRILRVSTSEFPGWKAFSVLNRFWVGLLKSMFGKCKR